MLSVALETSLSTLMNDCEISRLVGRRAIWIFPTSWHAYAASFTPFFAPEQLPSYDKVREMRVRPR